MLVETDGEMHTNKRIGALLIVLFGILDRVQTIITIVIKSSNSLNHKYLSNDGVIATITTR